MGEGWPRHLERAPVTFSLFQLGNYPEWPWGHIRGDTSLAWFLGSGPRRVWSRWDWEPEIKVFTYAKPWETFWLSGFLEQKDLLCHLVHWHLFIDTWFLAKPGNVTAWGLRALRTLVEGAEWIVGKVDLGILSPGIRAIPCPRQLSDQQQALPWGWEWQGPMVPAL